MAGPEGFVGETEAASAGPLGQADGEQGGPLPWGRRTGSEGGRSWDSLCRRDQRNAAWGLGGRGHRAASLHRDSQRVGPVPRRGVSGPPDRENKNVSRRCVMTPGDRHRGPLG